MNKFTPCIMCVQYIGGGGGGGREGRYHEYIGDVQYIGGYHDACGGQKPFNLY